MTAIIIGAWIWCAKKIDGRKKDSVHQWGEELFENHQLRFLLRRDAVIPALLPSDRPFIQSKFICEPVPRWKPLDDYTYFFLRCQQWDNVDLELLAVAELRWVASGGILSMDSHENIRAYNNRILAQNRPKEEKPSEKPSEKPRECKSPQQIASARRVLTRSLPLRKVWTCWPASKIGTTTNSQKNCRKDQEV